MNELENHIASGIYRHRKINYSLQTINQTLFSIAEFCALSKNL